MQRFRPIYSFFIHKHLGNTIAAIVLVLVLVFAGTDGLRALWLSTIVAYAETVPDARSHALAQKAKEAQLAKLSKEERFWLTVRGEDGSLQQTAGSWVFTITKAFGDGLRYLVYSDLMFPSEFGIPPAPAETAKNGDAANKQVGHRLQTDPRRWFEEGTDAINRAAGTPGFGGTTGERRIEGTQNTPVEGHPVNTAPPIITPSGNRDWTRRPAGTKPAATPEPTPPPRDFRDFAGPRAGQRPRPSPTPKQND